MSSAFGAGLTLAISALIARIAARKESWSSGISAMGFPSNAGIAFCAATMPNSLVYAPTAARTSSCVSTSLAASAASSATSCSSITGTAMDATSSLAATAVSLGLRPRFLGSVGSVSTGVSGVTRVTGASSSCACKGHDVGANADTWLRSWSYTLSSGSRMNLISIISALR